MECGGNVEDGVLRNRQCFVHDTWGAAVRRFEPGVASDMSSRGG